MSKTKHSAEQIVAKLRMIEIEISKGATTSQACKKAGITDQTYYRWRKEYGGMRLELEEWDAAADGVIENTTTYTYDGDGNQLTATTSGNVSTYQENAYDAAGNRMSEVYDFGHDGIVDRRHRYEYDDDGRMTLLEEDFEADGEPDLRETYTFDGLGNLLTQGWWFLAVEGAVEKRWTHTYDGGLLTRTDKIYLGTNVTVEERFTYTYDEDGNRTVTDWDPHSDDIIDERETCGYGCFDG